MNHNMSDMNRRKRSYEVHALDPAGHAYPGGMGAPSVPYQWHEMEYSTPSMEPSRYGPTSAPVQYSATGMMSFSPVDYSRHEYSFNNAYPEHDTSASAQAAALYRVGPFRYTDLANLDGDAASVSQESIYSRSTRLHSLTDSERRDSQPTSTLSGHDARRESEGFERMYPVTTMPLEHRHSDACVTDQSCLELSSLIPMGDCAPVHSLNSSPHFVTPRPPSNLSGSREPTSPLQRTASGFTSPTTLTFQDGTMADSSKALKPKRMPRSKSASATTGDNSILEKASKLRARQAHSLVERKYRDNLNQKISQLHQTLQNTQFGPLAASRSPQKESRSDYFDDETLLSPDIPNERSSTGSTPTGPKVRKSDVLCEAMSYVNATEVEMRHMSEEIIRLNARVKVLEKLARCEDCNLLKQMVTLDVERQQQAEVQQ